MTIVKPAKNRHSVTEINTGLLITIPGKIDWLSIPIISVALFFWVFIIVGFTTTVIKSIAAQQALGNSGFFEEGELWMILPVAFLVIWFGGLSIIGFLSFYNLLWQLRGREIIEIKKEKITIQHRVIRWERKKVFLSNDISDICISRPPTRFGFRKLIRLVSNSDGFIAFDYGAKTYCFGIDIDHAEAKQILDTITTRFPQYKTA